MRFYFPPKTDVLSFLLQNTFSSSSMFINPRKPFPCPSPHSGEKRIKYYSSYHEILLVGEGDFSFSLSLAMSFGSASNILATSLDSYDDVVTRYKNARLNLTILNGLGASVLHGVDATKMKYHTDLHMRKFDRIIFNFPHAGFFGRGDSHLMIRITLDITTREGRAIDVIALSFWDHQPWLEPEYSRVPKSVNAHHSRFMTGMLDSMSNQNVYWPRNLRSNFGEKTVRSDARTIPRLFHYL
ncbi:uncharacterized protein LOC101220669 [Cucumis sativus]|uniref:uncharacterized protein LOC101220669 n=1 Tax=Cucumis sativus TaxID=3659 RepID=UPI0012F4D2AF|nr:uncharacterized protein LOC101220669 [Cucumis sativus]